MRRVDLELVSRIDRVVRSRATYEPDPEMDDRWTSYADAVEAGERFKGDCDDWAMTALELLFREGVPKNRLYRAMVSTTGEEIDHMIGLVQLDNGSLLSVGDTMYTPRGSRFYDIRQTSRMDERRSDRLPLWRYWEKNTMQRTITTAAGLLAISAKGLNFIKGHERFMPRAYDDFAPSRVLNRGDRVRGTLTIGYGHTGPDVKIGDVWTEKKALEVLDVDLDRFERAVRRLVKVPLEQHEFDALVSFTFNVGEGNLAMSTLLKKINAGATLAEIQAQFRRWTRSKGVVLRGLVIRRDMEARMFAGEYPISTRAAPIVATPQEADISPVPFVEETRKLWKSVTVWGTGVIAACPMIVEAARELRNVGVEVDMGWVTGASGFVMVAGAGVLFAKRIYEIAVAARQ